MGRRARLPPAPAGIREQVDAVLSDPRVAWLPVRHHSPGSALHVGRWIRENRPAAVLVEGPDDANELLVHLTNPATRPPVAVLSVFTDVDGSIRPAGPDGPARFRALWPLVAHGPEWAALRAGAEVGAELRLVDVPHDLLVRALGGRTPGGHPREVEAFERLAARTGRRTFEAFFDATFETRAHLLTAEQWFRELLLLAACVRGPPGPAYDEDGTHLREGHMAWHVAEARKRHPEGRVAVVTGAFHALALPSTKARRAKGRGAKGVRVVPTATSHASLARLANVPTPAWAAALHRAQLRGDPDPAGAAAAEVLTRVAAALRAEGYPVGTADAVEATALSRGLAVMRGGGPVAVDVVEVAETAFVRGEQGVAGAALRPLVAAALTGSDRGELPPGAGRPPLTDDFYAEAKRHRVDVTGASKVVRCDLLREESHLSRSAFLHRATLLGVPLFEDLPDGQGPAWFKGPDPLRDEGRGLLGETWGIRAADDLEDHLLQLADRGTTVSEAAATSLGRLRASAGTDLRRRTEVVVLAARTRLLEVLPEALGELRAALPVSPAFDGRVYALRELLALRVVHETLPTFGSEAVGEVAERAFTAACLALPSLGAVRPEEVDAALDDLVTLVRAPTVADGLPLDRAALVEALAATWQGTGSAVIRGAAAGGSCALGELSERRLAALAAAAFRGADARAGAGFLEGVLRTSRSTLLTGRRLFEEVHALLATLDPEVFRAVLPDLRRAFAVFVPAELERLGEHVRERLSPSAPEVPDASDLVRARAARVDARVTASLGAEG